MSDRKYTADEVEALLISANVDYPLMKDETPGDTTIWAITGREIDIPVGEAESPRLAELFAAAPTIARQFLEQTREIEALKRLLANTTGIVIKEKIND